MFSAVAARLPGCIWFLLENMFFYVYQNLSNDVNDFNLGSCIFFKRIMLHNTEMQTALHCTTLCSSAAVCQTGVTLWRNAAQCPANTRHSSSQHLTTTSLIGQRMLSVQPRSAPAVSSDQIASRPRDQALPPILELCSRHRANILCNFGQPLICWLSCRINKFRNLCHATRHQTGVDISISPVVPTPRGA